MLSRYLEVLMVIGLVLAAIVATGVASADIDGLCVAGTDSPCAVVSASAPVTTRPSGTAFGM